MLLDSNFKKVNSLLSLLPLVLFNLNELWFRLLKFLNYLMDYRLRFMYYFLNNLNMVLNNMMFFCMLFNNRFSCFIHSLLFNLFVVHISCNGFWLVLHLRIKLN